MRSRVAQAIRDARRAAGLTQLQLGMRLGLKGRAVYRWERDDAAPTKRNRKALVTAIRAVNPVVADKLALAFEGDLAKANVVAAPALVTPAPLSGPAALELAVFKMSDELDLPSRRIRGSLVRLFKRLREGSVGLEAAQGHLERWVAQAE